MRDAALLIISPAEPSFIILGFYWQAYLRGFYAIDAPGFVISCFIRAIP